MGEGSRPPHHTLPGSTRPGRCPYGCAPLQGRIVERGRRRGSRTGHGRGE